MKRVDPDSFLRRLGEVQEALGLTAAAMASELGIRPEWLSKIRNRRVAPSYGLSLRLDDVLRRNGLKPDGEAAVMADKLLDLRNRNRGAAAVRAKIRHEYCRLIGQAGNDISRLSHLLTQLRKL